MALEFNPCWTGFYGLLDQSGEALAEMSTFGPQPGAERLSISLVALILENTGFKPLESTNPVYVLFLP